MQLFLYYSKLFRKLREILYYAENNSTKHSHASPTIKIAKNSKITAEPLVIHLKNFGLGDCPITARIVVKIIIHKNIPDKNIITIIKRDSRSGVLKSLNKIIVPAETHHRYDQGELTTIDKPVI